ncbi:hypothetical protein [Roseiconus lacunae]|uniref:Uncharacterized protein n=1 Tax=Roseiconus lacunae TaxID=2605694 RepID=A0ABT7PTI7_9BACT|nr:hypothetical protein [Roseiconus lacunae]MDM4019456.1 hypothetical protein [Roseiconus lacunae]
MPDADPETQLVEIESIRSAIGGLLEELGFEPDPAGLHVMGRGSWLWREWFKPSRPLQKEMSEIYEEMKEGLRREFLDKTGAEAFEKRANATAAVVKSLEAYSRAIVRLGDVIVAKAIVDGEPQLVVESLSPTIARELERRPELIRNPEAFIEFVGQYIETGTQVPANQEPLLSDPAQEQSIDLPRKG